MFATLASKRKVEEATSSKDDVAPVYLLEEIWQIAQSGGDAARLLTDWLVRRLGQKSPVIKQKTLRLIKYLCSKGSSEFKRNISKQSTAVRELTFYKGEPDPFKGDVVNQRVRDMAKETLESMFAAVDTSYNASTASSTSSLQGRIQGFGSSTNADGAAGPPAMSSSKVTGFGNPNFESRGREGRTGLSNIATTSSQWLSQATNSLSPKALRRQNSLLKQDQERNGGYDSDEAGSYSQPAAAGSAAAPYSSASGSAIRRPAAAEGEEEAALVDSLCTPGGFRAQPDSQDLRLFVEQAGQMDGGTLAALLEDKLRSGSWQQILRALCAVEAVIEQGSSAACGEIAVHFQSDPSAVRKAAASVQPSVRQRAQKLLQLLGDAPDAAGTAGPATAPAAAAAAAAEVDLLGGLSDDAPRPAQPAGGGDLLGDLMGPSPAAAQSAPPASNGLFAGLDLPASAPTAQPPAAQPPQNASPASLLAELVAPAPAPASTQAPGGDLFGGMTLQSGGPGGAGGLGDGLLGLEVPNAASSGASNGDIFAGLTASGGAPAAAASAGSAGLEDLFTSLSTSGASAPAAPASSQPAGGAFPQLNGSMSAGMGMGNGAASSRGYSGLQAAPSLGSAGQPMPMQMGQMGPPQMNGMQMGHMAGPPQMNGMQMQMGQMPGFMGMQGGMPGMLPPGVTPQQLQMMQMQMAQMQQLQMQQRMAMMGGAGGGMMPFQQQQQQAPLMGMGSMGSGGLGSMGSGALGSSGGGGAIPLDAFQDSGPKQDLLGRPFTLDAKQDTFEFVGEHISSTLRKK